MQHTTQNNLKQGVKMSAILPMLKIKAQNLKKCIKKQTKKQNYETL